MDIQTRKITFVQEFLRIQDEETISMLDNLLRQKKMEHYEKNQKPMRMENLEPGT